MLQSRNVTLRRSSDAPLRRLRDTYGSEDGAETQLEQLVLAGERRVKVHAARLTHGEDTRHMWTTLETLLADLNAYGALGKMGGADQRFCQRLQPLLARLTKSILSGGFDVAGEEEATYETEEAGRLYDVNELLQAVSKALSNCNEGVACRCADTTLEVQLATSSSASTNVKSNDDNYNNNHHNDQVISDHHDTPPLNKNEDSLAPVLCVCFGFADYASGETGAMLWAGAVGLSLYLIENFDVIIAKRAREVAAGGGQPLRMLELGCGPALVSLVVAAMAIRASPAVAPCWLDVTDISASVVDEARRSFETRNGPAFANMLVAENDGTKAGKEGVSVPHMKDMNGSNGASAPNLSTGFHVRPFILNFCDVPQDLYGAYDVIVASDVVYDPAIDVAPALELLLKPGGVALLCCEAHRDGMAYFTSRIRTGRCSTPHLRVAEEVRDVQTVLTRLQMLSSLTSSTCSFMRIEKSTD